MSRNASLAEEMGFMLWEEIPCYWNIDWSSEETYENAENQLLEMLGRIPALNGLCPWCLKDFRSPKRPLNGIQDDFNRKGLVDEQGHRKKAFYVVKEYYNNR